MMQMKPIAAAVMRNLAVARPVAHKVDIPKYRNVTRFDGVGVYGEFEETTVSGDFRVVVPVNVASDANWGTLISGSNIRLSATKAGHTYPLSVFAQIEGAAPLETSTNALTVGLTSEVALVRVADRLSIEVDEVELAAASGPQFAIPLNFSCFGKNISAQGGADPLKGCYPAPAKIYDAGTLVGLYKLDRADGVLRNYAPCGGLGPDVKNSVAGNSWTHNADGTYTHTGSNWSSWLELGGDPQTAYWVDVSATNVQATALSNGSNATLAEGRQLLFLPAGATAPRIGSNTGTTIEVHFVRRAEGWGLMHNLAADSVKRYRLEGDGDLVGVENLATNGGFDSGTGWTQSGTAISNSAITFGLGTTFAENVPSLDVGEQYKFSFDLTDFTGGLVGISSTTIAGGLYADTVGRNSFTGVATVSYVRVVSTVAGNVLDNLKVQHLIPASPLYKLRRKIERLLKTKAGKVRTIPRFDGESMRGDILTWTASGDFEVSAKLPVRSTEGGNILSGPTDRVAQNTGLLYVGRSGEGDQQSVIPFGLTGQNLLKIYRRGSSSRASVDGELLALNGGAVISGSLVLDRIGHRWDGATGIPNFKGHIQYVALIDLDNPLGNSRLYLMDSDTGILYDALSESGPELVSQNADDWQVSNAALTFLGGRVRVANTTDGRGSATLPLGLIAGTRVKATLSNKVGSGEGWLSAPFTSMAALTNTVVETITNTGTLTLRCNSYTAGDYVEYDLPSIKEAPNAGQIHNAPADAYPQFIYQGDHAKKWLSPELSNRSETSGDPDYYGTGYWYWDLAVLTAGRTYRVAATKRSTTPTHCGFSSSTGTPAGAPFRNAQAVTVGGEYTAASNGDSRLFYKDDGNPTDYENITVRETLKEAV